MRQLKLRGFKGIPFISLDFDNGHIQISGELHSQLIERHFLPVIAALQSQTFRVDNIEIHFLLDQINANGNYELIRFLKMIKQRQTQGLSVICYWYQQEGVYEELGDRLGELLGLNFKNVNLPPMVNELEYDL